MRVWGSQFFLSGRVLYFLPRYAFYPDLLALFMFPSILSLGVGFLLRCFPLLA
jgi:hypothetical protein